MQGLASVLVSSTGRSEGGGVQRVGRQAVSQQLVFVARLDLLMKRSIAGDAEHVGRGEGVHLVFLSSRWLLGASGRRPPVLLQARLVSGLRGFALGLQAQDVGDSLADLLIAFLPRSPDLVAAVHADLAVV